MKLNFFSHDFPKKLNDWHSGWKNPASMGSNLAESFAFRAQFRRDIPSTTTLAHEVPWHSGSTLRDLRDRQIVHQGIAEPPRLAWCFGHTHVLNGFVAHKFQPTPLN
ncbi:hypothetical protein [Ruegeria denitrificans]|uniref:hypothetical protein n=1 Tax=Ruegeria denitrificans TaxID=1715692 RepID=UPI003C7A57A4